MTEFFHVTAETLRSIAEDAARSMCERAAEAAADEYEGFAAACAIRDLPLLAGTDRPDLVELEGRLDTLEMRLSAVEDQLSPPTTRGRAAPAEPTRYRDRRGDIWETQGNGDLRAIGVHRDRFELLNTVLPHAVVEKDHGILARMPGRNDPCEVCGRAPDAQEHGPDGKCRHTPATRLGKPAGGDR